jgi:hypothetical protein
MHTEVIIALVSICGQEDLNIANSLSTRLSGISDSHLSVISQSSRVSCNARKFVTKERAHNTERLGIGPVDGTERVEKADAVERLDARLTLSSSVSAPKAGTPLRRFASRWEGSAFRFDMRVESTIRA